jgi:hypothetical protein
MWIPLSCGQPHVSQFFEVQVVQELVALFFEPDPPVPTLNEENSFCTLFEEHSGHFTIWRPSSVIRSSKVFPHLRHSYSNMGKVIPPSAFAT